MYDFLINAIRVKHNLNSDQQLCSFLQSLQDPVKSLRKAYSQYPVSFDYSQEKNQAAYFISYFPHYTLLLTRIFIDQHEKIETHTFDKHDLLLFGGGPCPELVGYLRFLQQKKTTKTILNVLNFDIAADTWAYSRDMNVNHVIPQYIGLNKIEEIKINKIDFTSPWTVTMSSVPKIVVFQNCFNEPREDQHSTLIENLEKLYAKLPPKSTIIIVDLANYPAVKDLIEKIENKVKIISGCKILRAIKDGDIELRSLFADPTQIIKENLLTGVAYNIENGLIPRTKIKFTYSMIYKN